MSGRIEDCCSITTFDLYGQRLLEGKKWAQMSDIKIAEQEFLISLSFLALNRPALSNRIGLFYLHQKWYHAPYSKNLKCRIGYFYEIR